MFVFVEFEVCGNDPGVHAGGAGMGISREGGVLRADTLPIDDPAPALINEPAFFAAEPDTAVRGAASCPLDRCGMMITTVKLQIPCFPLILARWPRY